MSSSINTLIETALDPNLAAIARKVASLRLSLDAALAANRGWADQPVPKEVQDALSQP